MLEKKFSLVKKQFVISIVGFSMMAVFALGFLLYETNTIQFDSDVSSAELHNVIEGNDAVEAYLEEEKDYEAHFITIASLIRDDQKEKLGDAMLLIALPVLIVTGFLGYWIARRLLTPVEESYKSQERFIQDAAHELRNPLAAMSATLQGYKMGGDDNKLVTSMKRQTKRLVRISEDLLFLEKRNTDEPINSINISELLEDVLEDMHAHAGDNKIKFISNIKKDISLKISDQDFVRLTKNIIGNAIKYSHSNGAVKINLEKVNNHILLSVADKGIGIPEEEIDSIGERFYRAKNASKYDGNGLGMSIVRKIVNRYGAHLIIESELGKGTTVNIKF